MRRRSVSTRIFIIAVVLFFSTIILFTKILVPAERLVLDGLGGIILGVRSFQEIISGDMSVTEGKARVIARRADEFQNTFIISSAVSEGSSIISGDTMIGIVVTKGSITSKVEAITSPGFIIHGVLSRSGIPMELHGKGAMLLEARLPRGADIAKGDMVVEDQVARLGIGSVVDIVDIASDPFITIIVQSPVNLYTLSLVDVREENTNIR